MADEYVCDHCKKYVDTIYFYKPLCEKCYRSQKEKDNAVGEDSKEIDNEQSFKQREEK